MARIRSIKPEFWRDEKIATLQNKLAGYFFIGLWNVADDEGKFPFSPKSLSLQLPIFRSKEVVTYLSELTQKGLIRESVCSQWGLVVNWGHQKIDKPKVPQIKVEDIQWLDIGVSSIDRDKSKNILRKDRIGSDRIGSDRIGSTISSEVQDSRIVVPMQSKKAAPRNNPDLNREIWESYKEAYLLRYKTDPVRNGSVNSKISQLAKRLGQEAIQVVAFYVAHNDFFYVKAMHPIGLCLAHAEGLRTQWRRGKAVTTRDVKDFENKQEFNNLINDIKENGI